MSFFVGMFNKKAPFLTKKTPTVKSETHFSIEAIKNYRGKVLKDPETWDHETWNPETTRLWELRQNL